MVKMLGVKIYNRGELIKRRSLSISELSIKPTTWRLVWKKPFRSYYNVQYLVVDLEALQRECKDGTFGYRCLFTCSCYRNRVCDKKTGRCPRDECANGFWGQGCQLGNHKDRSLDTRNFN
jgi:hypothetical protein